MKAQEHEEAFDEALDALAADDEIDAATYQEILGDVEYKVHAALRASVDEHGDLSG